jgi:uncharacterized protein
MSRERVFVDTGAWLALALADDQYHSLAGQTLSRLLGSSTRLVTTNQVVGETYTFLVKVRSPRIALAFVDQVRASMALDYFFIEEDLEIAAYNWLKQYADQKFSFVDATSFVMMTELKLRKVFAFDRHFVTAGFIRVPLDSAF